jgi:DNA invertase Pin-like site-specific DNA recombinase
MTYGYIRVSTDKQEVESQKIGIVKKAEELHLSIDSWISDEGVSGTKEYNERELGKLMKKLAENDVIIVSEISRLARSVFMLFRIIEFCNTKKIIIYSVKDSISTVKPDDLSSMMMIFCFGIAAQIEREMIVKRTIEGMERRGAAGVVFGRPIGSSGIRKLSSNEAEIKKLLANRVSKAAIAKILNVDRQTLYNFLEHKEIMKPSHSNGRGRFKNLLDNNKQEILSLAESGITAREIAKRFEVNFHTFRFWYAKRENHDVYETLVSLQEKLRHVKNADCGKNKRHYKF